MATVTGIISDASGTAVANAPVTLKNLETGQIYTSTSSDTGNYGLSQLPIGDYDLTISSAWFTAYTHTSFHLSAGQTMREDVLLRPGESGGCPSFS